MSSCQKQRLVGPLALLGFYMPGTKKGPEAAQQRSGLGALRRFLYKGVLLLVLLGLILVRRQALLGKLLLPVRIVLVATDDEDADDDREHHGGP